MINNVDYLRLGK